MIWGASAIPAATESHCKRLAFALLDAGVIQRGRFTFVNFEHDKDCPALGSSSALDCRFSPNAIVNGRSYSFEEIFGQSVRA